MASLLFGLASATTSNSAGNMARAYVGTLLVGLASATTSNSAGNMARAYIGTLRLNVSDNSYAAADSVLPFFQFQNCALARGAPQRALDALSTTAFAHYAHGPRPHLIGIWTDAQIAIEEAAKGRPLTAIERKHVKYDPKRAPPKAVGALNMPKATAPPGAHWP